MGKGEKRRGGEGRGIKGACGYVFIWALGLYQWLSGDWGCEEEKGRVM